MVKSTKLTDQREYANTLLYGEGGTGKTTALAHMANLGRVLYIDAEAGLKRRPLAELGVEVDNIERLDFGPDGLSFAALEDVFWSLKRDLDADPDAWAGVAMDSGTEVYHGLLESLVGKRVEKAEALIKQNRQVADVMADRFFIDRDDYGVMSEQVRFLMRRFRDLPCHFGTAFLERRDQDKDTSTVRVGPSITPGLQSDMVGWHDVVGHCAYLSGLDLYVGTFRPEGVRVGKDRFGVLPRVMVDPTFDRIAAYVSGELTAADDPRQSAYEEATGAERTEEEVQAGDTEASPLEKARAEKRASKTAGRAKG